MGSRANKDARATSEASQGVVRNKPGPASPEVVHRELDKRLAEREPRPSAPAKPAPETNPTKDLSILGTIDKIKERKYRLKEEADKAQ